MAFTIRVDLHAEDVLKMLTLGPKTLMTTMRGLLGETVTGIRNDVLKYHMTGTRTTPTRVARRSGTLISSFKKKVTGNTLETLQGSVYFIMPGEKYAATHVLGTASKGGVLADIVSTSGKYLPIPLPAALTAGGKRRGGPQSGMFGDTFVKRSRRGNLIIFGRLVRQRGAHVGESWGNLVPLFVLKKSVSIPARIGMLEWAKYHVLLLEQKAGARFNAAMNKV